MYLGAQPSRQKSQSTRPGAYSALLSFLNITSGDFAGNCLTHPKHLKSPMHCARLTRVPCTMAAGSGTGWAGIEGSHRGLTASAQVGETPVRPPPELRTAAPHTPHAPLHRPALRASERHPSVIKRAPRQAPTAASMAKMLDPYRVLKVDKDAPQEEIS